MNQNTSNIQGNHNQVAQTITNQIISPKPLTKRLGQPFVAPLLFLDRQTDLPALRETFLQMRTDKTRSYSIVLLSGLGGVGVFGSSC
ncbi:MAG: hypothetical protein EAZ95_04465 [Bacteroidetes bacterium]|nr:MAG: hypothetical protein EAZ95_04465 [Bacteroidota bacterium]